MSDIIYRAGLGLFGAGPWAPPARGKYFTQVFSGN